MNPKTDAQRAAVHVWCRHVAEGLNSAGITKSLVLELLKTRGLEAEWTEDSFKHDVYKPIFKAMTGHQSTEKASTVDHSAVVEAFQRWSDMYLDGFIAPPFPSRHDER